MPVPNWGPEGTYAANAPFDALAARYSSSGAQLERQPALAQVETVLSDALDLSTRVQAIIDRFCGQIPTGVGGEQDKAPSPSGILPALEDRATAVRSSLHRAMAALERLERELP